VATTSGLFSGIKFSESTIVTLGFRDMPGLLKYASCINKAL
jgi:hypothetical protein